MYRTPDLNLPVVGSLYLTRGTFVNIWQVVAVSAPGPNPTPSTVTVDFFNRQHASVRTITLEDLLSSENIYEFWKMSWEDLP